MPTTMTKIPLILCVWAGACFAQSESLLIGRGDLLHVQVFDTPEMEQHPRVTDSGEAPLLFVGNVKVSGLTPAEAGNAIETKLKDGHYMLHPHVSVVVDDYATQTVSVMGQVNRPGNVTLSTPMPILNLLSASGGLTESADRHITIQRQSDPSRTIGYFVSNKSDEALTNSVQVYPGDTVLVPKTGIVYVLGDVGRPGGFPMSGNNSDITVLQALALAGAANKSSVLSKAKLIRKTDNRATEIPMRLEAMQKGKVPDIKMLPDDILYVPSSLLKNLAVNSSAIVAAATSSLVYARP